MIVAKMNGWKLESHVLKSRSHDGDLLDVASLAIWFEPDGLRFFGSVGLNALCRNSTPSFR
jgi:hypothetical protein